MTLFTIIYDWSNLLTHFKSKNLLLCKNDIADTFGTQIEKLCGMHFCNPSFTDLHSVSYITTQDFTD